MNLKNLDNPWLLRVLPLTLPIYGLILGFILGPIFYPAPPPASGLDVYAVGTFTPSEACAAMGFAIGLLLAIGICVNLIRQSNQAAALPPEPSAH